MAITSKFYTGAVDNVDWAEGTRMMGYRYVVWGASHFRVAPDGAVARGLSVQPGDASGGGIADHNDAVMQIALPFNAADRWHLVGLRRRWGATNATTLYSITGTATKQLPSRLTDPGVEDVHPLALCFVAGGSATVSVVVDLRAFSDNSGMLIANDDLARTFLNGIGTRIRVGTTEWTRILVSGAPEWTSAETAWSAVGYENTVATGVDATPGPASNWQRQVSSRVVRDGKWRHVHLVLRRSGPNFQFDSIAGATPSPITVAELFEADRPVWRTPVAATIITTSGGEYAAGVYIEQDGKVILHSGPRTGTIGPAGPLNTLTIDAAYVVS